MVEMKKHGRVTEQEFRFNQLGLEISYSLEGILRYPHLGGLRIGFGLACRIEEIED